MSSTCTNTLEKMCALIINIYQDLFCIHILEHFKNSPSRKKLIANSIREARIIRKIQENKISNRWETISFPCESIHFSKNDELATRNVIFQLMIDKYQFLFAICNTIDSNLFHKICTVLFILASRRVNEYCAIILQSSSQKFLQLFKAFGSK